MFITVMPLQKLIMTASDTITGTAASFRKYFSEGLGDTDFLENLQEMAENAHRNNKSFLRKPPAVIPENIRSRNLKRSVQNEYIYNPGNSCDGPDA